ncbi:MAG: hypothetical protein PVJ84_19305 [Desulfobacteraceae bacterium]|jgi:hypothetical protein
MKRLLNRNYAINSASLALACLLVISATVTWASADSKSEELQGKIADIVLLKQQLADRKTHAEAMQVKLLEQQADLVTEVRLLQKSFGFKSYQQARQYERVHYNIELIQAISAYNLMFTDKIRIYQTGHDKLDYLQQLVEDDIKMMRTLNDFEIDALTTQISLVINRYIGEAHIIQIDQKSIKLTPAKKIWEGVVNGTY